jgi:hypothetical protein
MPAAIDGPAAQPIAPPPPAVPAPVPLRDDQLLFEGFMSIWTPGEDRAIIDAVRRAPGGKPSAACFQLALREEGSPLAGRSAELLCARARDLLRRLNRAAKAAKAAKEGAAA